MSSPTWTPAALSSELRPHAGAGWRLVEAQHRVSTLRLVDNLAEQALLEDLVEESKPPVPPECRHLHYLLYTPFRYGAPYPRGSRFRRAGRTPGVWYGAERPETAVAEMAFHRFLFFAESPETPWPNNAAAYTAFSAGLASEVALDLTEPPLARDEAAWTDPADYGPCQTLAEAAREAGCDLIRYRSVRDPAGDANLAVLRCSAFASPGPKDYQTWRIHLDSRAARAIREHPALALEFPLDAFTDPRLASLAR